MWRRRAIPCMSISAAAHQGDPGADVRRRRASWTTLPPIAVYEPDLCRAAPGGGHLRRLSTSSVRGRHLDRGRPLAASGSSANVNFGDYESRNWFDTRCSGSRACSSSMEEMGIQDGDTGIHVRAGIRVSALIPSALSRKISRQTAAGCRFHVWVRRRNKYWQQKARPLMGTGLVFTLWTGDGSQLSVRLRHSVWVVQLPFELLVPPPPGRHSDGSGHSI